MELNQAKMPSHKLKPNQSQVSIIKSMFYLPTRPQFGASDWIGICSSVSELIKATSDMKIWCWGEKCWEQWNLLIGLPSTRATLSVWQQIEWQCVATRGESLKNFPAKIKPKWNGRLSNQWARTSIRVDYRSLDGCHCHCPSLSFPFSQSPTFPVSKFRRGCISGRHAPWIGPSRHWGGNITLKVGQWNVK